MARQEGQKPKILVLLRILEEQTDEEHLLSVPQLVELLAEQNIPSERKSIYADIEALKEMGYDIRLRRGRKGGYYMGSRTFSLAELTLLVDAVQSNRFFSRAKSDALTQKLMTLASRYQKDRLNRPVHVVGRSKNMNERTLESVDVIYRAIANDRMLSFSYANGKNHQVSPWRMVCKNGCYYLIAYQDYAPPYGMRHYRVEQMSYTEMLSIPRRGKAHFTQFDVSGYLKKLFRMEGGQECLVTLQCDSRLETTMRERFGAAPIFVRNEEGLRFQFTTSVFVNDPFLGWICSFGGRVVVLSPESVKRRLYAMGKQMTEDYASVAVRYGR